jgi:hypothetical protein
MAVSGASWSVVPFTTVDCSDCGGEGWYELHALFWDAPRQRTCFGIFYLMNRHPDLVGLEYARCLPDLGDPLQGAAWFDATWTAPQKAT